jgi:hypothetical protein
MVISFFTLGRNGNIASILWADKVFACVLWADSDRGLLFPCGIAADIRRATRSSRSRGVQQFLAISPNDENDSRQMIQHNLTSVGKLTAIQ